MKTLKLALFCVTLLGFSAQSYADTDVSLFGHSFSLAGNVQLSLSQNASVMITYANGDVTFVDNAQDIPTDLNGATVDVLSGCATFSGGSSLTLCSEDASGEAEAVQGPISMTTALGETVVLNTGDLYTIIPQLDSNALAPATAAGEEVGSNIQDLAPFDATSSDDRTESVSP